MHRCGLLCPEEGDQLDGEGPLERVGLQRVGVGVEEELDDRTRARTRRTVQRC